MACNYTKYDIKKVLYSAVDSADFLVAPVLSAMQEILINKDISVDTKGETITYSILNSTRNVDEISEQLRQTGTIKITKNFDSSLIDNHPYLIGAGLGKINGSTSGNVTVTAGKGSVGTPFLTSSTANVIVGNLVYTSEGLKRVVSLVANTSFVIDTPLQTTISTSTVLPTYNSIDVTDPRGTCDKAFNFAVLLHDDRYLMFKGCNIRCEFNPVYEKQLSITFNIESQDVTEASYDNENISATFSGIVSETRGTPIKCNFDACHFQNSNTVTPHFPMGFELGLTITTEKEGAIGGLNNVIGYQNRASVKPKMKLGRNTAGKTISAYSSCSFSAYQPTFGIYIQNLSFYNVNKSENMNNFDSISCECNANTLENSKVYLILP